MAESVERARSFGSVAEQYDRFRPSYPVDLVDDLAALRPGDVLDVGCGTGKVAALLADRGLPVLGVEADERMARLARDHGIPVEIGTFEQWDAGGRTFDLITCGQAWHWIDPVIGAAKAASLLRPGGTLALFWNYAEPAGPVRDALRSAYRRLAPELAGSVALSGGERQERARGAGLERAGHFVTVSYRTYRWQRVLSATEWVATTATHSDHLLLQPERRERLLSALREVIDAHGGTVRSDYGTHTVFARVAG